jgi:outer membrane lipoprotein-sorting protein
MTFISRIALLPVVAIAPLLSGCFIISTHSKLPVPMAPAVTQTATPEELVAQVNKRWDNLQTLTATVTVQLSTYQTSAGVATNYTTFPGVILIRKPEMLRVFGQYPVVHTRMLDIVSDGKNFTLWIPNKNKVIKGSNTLGKKSDSTMENIRPAFFFDAMVIRGVDPGDDYLVSADSETVEDVTKKRLLFTPEYNLTIAHRKADSHELKPVRVITFHREDLLPYEQDLYDNEGNLETHVSYANYTGTGDDKYPQLITIKRPNDGFQIVITVESVKENQKLEDEQFHFDVPDGTTVENLK